MGNFSQDCDFIGYTVYILLNEGTEDIGIKCRSFNGDVSLGSACISINSCQGFPVHRRFGDTDFDIFRARRCRWHGIAGFLQGNLYASHIWRRTWQHCPDQPGEQQEGSHH